ncbi:Homeodomain-like superfamily protein [Hirschfeldia incana]|nr:Homeodomain-like superfamily protein [Hirschfeldia incana]
MDFDFDDEPAAPAARAGAKFKPRGRPQPKKKQASVSTSQTTLSTDIVKEKLSTQSDHPVSLDASSTIVPDGGTICQSTTGTMSKENLDGFSGASVLRACTNLNQEGKSCEDGTETAPANPDDPRRQDCDTFGDFVTTETDEVINADSQRTQTGEEGEECHWNMENLDIVQEEGITSTYEQHTGKFQPKPRLLDTVIEEEPESHYSVDETMGANQSEFMVNEESRNVEFNTNSTFHGDHQEEEHNIPEVPRETAPGVVEQEHHVVSPSNNDTVMGEGEPQSNEAEAGTDNKKGKKKRARKKKTTTSEEEPQKKKFKHSSRRQKNITLDKELIETPVDQLKKLPIKDLLRLGQYKQSLEKKEAKGAPAVPPTQESNTHASEFNQYYSQGFDAEDEFGMEEEENQETYVVKPDSPVNYQTYMNKTPRIRWSKQDTERFYKGIQTFGSNLPLVRELFEDERTLQQIKLKFKLEERKNPLKLNAALLTREKDLTLYNYVIKKLEEKAAAEKKGEEEEWEGEGEEAGEEAETTTDVPENEEPTKTEETERAGGGVAGVKESDGGDVENGVRSDGGDECDDNEDDDDDFWNSYKSEM